MMLWTGILFTIFAVAAWLLIRSHIVATSDQLLIGWKLELQSKVEPWPGRERFIASIPDQPLQTGIVAFPICVTDLSGNTLHQSAGGDWLARFALSNPDITESLGRGFTPEIHMQLENFRSDLFSVSSNDDANDTALHRILRVTTPHVVVLAGLDMSAFNAGLLTLQQYFLIGLIIGLLLILIGTWWTARHALLPLRRIRAAAAAIRSSANLSDRIASNSKDYVEFITLIEALNMMMTRLEHNFQRATRFSADASHELKTPIALLQNAANKGIKEAAPGSKDEENFLEITMEIARLKKIIEALLLLSSADAGRINLKRSRVALSEELEGLCEDAEILAEEKGLTLTHDIQADLATEADPVLLMQAIQNLISNAIKYNRPAGRIHIACRNQGNQIVLDIENTGPAIPPDQRQAIFDRFHRVARARADEPGGSGLGLNLAREIANAHEGSVELVCGNENAICFRLTLPAEA